jgi:putative ABC transport system ATP-binding protein
MSVLLAFDDVSKRFWRGNRPVDVLDEVSLELSAGELGAVWGPRSAGKSTLLELAAGLQAPDSGRIRFNGSDLTQLSRKARGALLHDQIGISTRVGPATRDLAVNQWIAMALMDRMPWSEALRQAGAVLARVNASDVAHERWYDLSDGERTLASVARAIVRRPRLLLVDDPSAGLGLLERGEIATLLKSIAEEAGVAVLMTAAEVTEIQGAETIWSLAGGRLVGRAAPPGATVVAFPTRSAAAQS